MRKIFLMLFTLILSVANGTVLTHVVSSPDNKPDLSIVDVKIKKNIKSGDIIGKNREILIIIKNIGKKTAPKSILKLVCKSRNGCPKILNGTVNISSLRPNQTKKIYWPLKYSNKYRWKEGEYRFRATVHILQTNFTAAQVSSIEKNINNNKKDFIVKVLGEDKSDLTISNIKLSKKICSGDLIRKSGKILVTIKNIGKKDAPATTLKVSCINLASSGAVTSLSANFSGICPDFLKGMAKIPSIKSGHSYILKWPYNKNKKWRKGKYKLEFFVDDRNRIKESKEDNNKKYFILEVKECKPKLSMVTKPTLKVPKFKKKIIFDKIFPSYWYSGKKYEIIVRGKGFSKNLDFKFDKKFIKIISKKYINSNMYKLTINISEKIKPSKTRLYYKEIAKNSKYLYTGLYGWLKEKKKHKKIVVPKIKLPKISYKVPFIKGKIILERPRFGKSGSGDVYQDLGIPKLNDKTVFSFREQNPGLADWFELQILDKSGKVLVKRDLGKNLYYRADPDFVYEVLSLLKQKGLLKISNILKKSSKINTSALKNIKNNSKKTKISKKEINYFKLTPQKKRKSYIEEHNDEISLYWAVIGKKRFPKDGIVKIGDHERKIVSYETVLVEESEKWPLKVNDFTTGFSCRSTSKGNINIQNLDLGQEEPGKVSTVNYVGDRFELSGVFDISDSPWGFSRPNQIFTNGGMIDASPVPRNIFISWGDGTVESLDMVPLESFGTRFRINNMIHQYASTGKKKIKIFMLPESEIQNINVSSMVFAYDFYEGSKTASLNAVSMNSSFDNPYYQVLGLSGDLPKPNADLLNIAKHAYIIYCNQIAIEPRKDLVASGPLHLDDIFIYDYNGGKVENEKKYGLNIQENLKNTQVNIEKYGTKNIKIEKKSIQKKVDNKNNKKEFLFKTSTEKIKNIQEFAKGIELSECDILQANAKLRYYGKGSVLFKWKLIGPDGNELILESKREDIGPSRFRENLTKDNYKIPTQDSYSYYPLLSKVLYLEEFTKNSQYELVVDAIVDPITALALSQEEMINTIKAIIENINLGVKYASNKITPKIYLAKKSKISNPYIAQIKQSGAKFGVLSPNKIASKNMPVVASINKVLDKSNIGKALAKIKIPKRKPYYVKSEPFRFSVVPNSGNKPCKLKLVTKSNDIFWIRNISNSVTVSQGNIYNGSGNLILKINSSIPQEVAVPVLINNWHVGGSDGITVQSGKIDTSLDSNFVADGVEFGLKNLYCEAKNSDMLLTTDIKLQNGLLRNIGSSDSLEWKKLTSRVDENGNWHYELSQNREFSIGWSGFRLKTSKIYLDFDKNWGRGVSNECSQFIEKEWTGVHLTDATIFPNTFDLVQSGYTKNVNNWGISGNGLCGKVQFGHFSTNIKKGSISFQSIEAEAKNGNFYATYKNMDVYVPWLDTHLKGDAKLVDGANSNEPSIDFKGLSSSDIEKDYGVIHLKASDLVFGSYKDIGWGVWSNTYFSLSTKTKKIVNEAPVNGLVYGFDARAYITGESNTKTVSISGKAEFGGTEVDLISMEITSNKSGKSLIDFVLNTNFNVSEVLSTVPVTVRYSINNENENIFAVGPNVDPFVVPAVFPEANPNMESRIAFNYEKDSGETSQNNPAKYDQYSGDVEFELFEGQTIRAAFRLGYINHRDYWMIKASMPFEDGIELMSPGLMLYEIRGGLAHNFPLDSFKKDGSIFDITPKMDGTYMFFAGVDVGHEQKNLYYAKGDLVIKINWQARLDARAWLLDYKRKGDGTFQGYLQYANGSIDGSIWGKLSLLKGAIVAEIPQNAAVLHISRGDWYFYFGRKEGPRVRMKVLISEADSYLELEPGRYAVGARNFWGLKGKYGRIYGELESGYEIRFPPHVSGYGEGTLSAQICCCEICIGPSLSARVEASALPIHAKARACFDFGWPIGDICGTFKF
ncbi:CARDB domain-containing protein [Nitrosophilus kaiyonis]|uniref:CARDB domain-containing protein n=1 Tax=Nitrosophilus kaiyonis TaxID=2930200 RepID=UPI002491BBDB|nr:CARDB domain-containing protein [Nitrosophilus kaiyonis]